MIMMMPIGIAITIIIIARASRWSCACMVVADAKSPSRRHKASKRANERNKTNHRL